VIIRLHYDFGTTKAAKLQGDIKWHIGKNMPPDEVALHTFLEEEHPNSYLGSKIGPLIKAVLQNFLVLLVTRQV